MARQSKEQKIKTILNLLLYRGPSVLGINHTSAFDEAVISLLALIEPVEAPTEDKRAWTKNMRETGLLEWVCEHGVGHPDHKSAKQKGESWQHCEEISAMYG